VVVATSSTRAAPTAKITNDKLPGAPFRSWSIERAEPLHLLVDSTGLKIYEGERLDQKHGIRGVPAVA
jgi:hypothetical protein